MIQFNSAQQRAIDVITKKCYQNRRFVKKVSSMTESEKTAYTAKMVGALVIELIKSFHAEGKATVFDNIVVEVYAEYSKAI